MDAGYGTFNIEVLRMFVCRGEQDWGVLGDYRVGLIVVQLLLTYLVILSIASSSFPAQSLKSGHYRWLAVFGHCRPKLAYRLWKVILILGI